MPSKCVENLVTRFAGATRCVACQAGSALSELLLVAPLLLLIGLGTVQVAMLYRAKILLDYAAFEAVRTGAVTHALETPMRRELGRRLAPLFSAGRTESAAKQHAMLYSADAANVSLQRINPSAAAFDDWGEPGSSSGGRRIPNAHLNRSSPRLRGVHSGLSLVEANILKLEITYLHELELPVIRQVLGLGMPLVDPENQQHYRHGRFPLSATATIRMQSDAWENPQATLPRLPTGGSETGVPGEEPTRPPGQEPGAPPLDDGDTEGNGESESPPCTESGDSADDSNARPHLWSSLPEADAECGNAHPGSPPDPETPGAGNEPCS